MMLERDFSEFCELIYSNFLKNGEVLLMSETYTKSHLSLVLYLNPATSHRHAVSHSRCGGENNQM